MKPRGHGLATGFLLAAILAVAAWARLAIYPLLFANGELIPQHDGDSFYHLQRSLETLRNLPHVPHLDPSMNWPKGALIPWSDGFDLSAALFALSVGGGRDADVAWIAIALWPVALGLVLVAATWRMVRVCLPGPGWQGAALAAAAGVALMPGGIHTALFGRVDHHVVEALSMVLLATWAMQRFPGPPRATPERPWRFELEGAVLSGLSVYAYSGSPIYVAIAALPLARAAFTDGRLAGSGAPGLLGGGALALLLSVPFVLDSHILISFKYPSLLQPLFVLGCGAFVGSVAWVGSAPPRARRRRALLAAGLGALAVVAVGIASSALHEVREAILGWLLHRDPWLDSIQEFSPMLVRSRFLPSPWTRVHQEFGWGGFFLPLALFLVVALVGRRPRVRALLFATLGIAALALVSNRFSRIAVPFVAACNGVALAALLRAVARGRRWGRAPAWAPLVFLAAGVVDLPTLGLLVPPRPRVPPIVEASIELRNVPPHPSLPRGVLSNWSYGHQIEVTAGLPVVVNGFGSFLDAPRFWEAVEVFKGTSAGLDAYMTSNRLGTLLAGTATIGAEVTGANESISFEGGVLNKVYMQSLPLSPLLIAGSAIPGWDVPHLPHLMPRYASSAISSGLGFALPFVWIFERVEGAKARGTAAPGVRVVAELEFSEHRRPHVYKAFVDASPEGTWELTLPLPCDVRRASMRSGARWTASAGGGATVPFVVTEDDVRQGRVVEVGTLPPPPAGD